MVNWRILSISGDWENADWMMERLSNIRNECFLISEWLWYEIEAGCEYNETRMECLNHGLAGMSEPRI